MTKEETLIEETVKEFGNHLALQLNPSTDTMNAIRLLRKELPSTLHSLAQKVREEVIEEVFEIEQEKWRDAEHCTCLGYALIEISGGKGSEGGKNMEKRLLALTPPQEDITNSNTKV